MVINDNYRLERYLCEALIYGNKAYVISREKEAKIRSDNQMNYDIYKVFLSINKIDLNEILNERCEAMVKRGLLNEVGDIIKKRIINEDNINNKLTPGLNAYGVMDSIKLLTNLYKIYDDKDKVLSAINKYGKKVDPYYLQYRKQINKFVWEFFAGFSAKNRQYARRQATWFRNQDEFLWKLNKRNYDMDYVVHDIIGIVEKPIEEYKLLLNSEENIQNKNKYTDNTTSSLHMPKFNMLKDRKELTNFVKQAFEIVNENKEELLKIINHSEKEKLPQREEEFDDIKKYLL